MSSEDLRILKEFISKSLPRRRIGYMRKKYVCRLGE
jgi:hypothetical protein